MSCEIQSICSLYRHLSCSGCHWPGGLFLWAKDQAILSIASRNQDEGNDHYWRSPSQWFVT